MRHVLALLVVPTLAWAAPKFTTAMAVTVEGGAATFKIDAKLDACWKKPTRVKARVTIENGRITGVEFLENSQPRSAVCLKKALLAAKTDATAGVVAMIELDGQKVEEPEPPKAIFEDKNKKKLDHIISREVTGLGKFKGVEGGAGKGTGTGVGDGTGTVPVKRGTGGGGNVEGDFVARIGPDSGGAGKPMPSQVKVVVGEPITEGDGNGLTVEQIDRVVKARAGIFRACYQKELNRAPGLAGKLVVAFTIVPGGTVTNAAAKPERSTLKSENVEKCVVRNVERLKFPTTESKVNVTYPFIFVKSD